MKQTDARHNQDSFFCMKAGRFSSPRMAVRSSLSCWKSRFSKILNLGLSRTGGKRGYQEILQELHHNMHPATFQITTAECNTMVGFTTAKCNTMVGFTFFNPQSLVNSKTQSSPDCKTIFGLIALQNKFQSYCLPQCNCFPQPSLTEDYNLTDHLLSHFRQPTLYNVSLNAEVSTAASLLSIFTGTDCLPYTSATNVFTKTELTCTCKNKHCTLYI